MRQLGRAMSAETRTFTSPSGRTWTAALFSGVPGTAPVLRFRSGDVVLDLSEFPADWARLPDAALVALARRGEPPRFAPPVSAPPSAGAAVAAAPIPNQAIDFPEMTVAEGDDTFANRMALAFLSLQVRSGSAGRIERVSPGAFAALVQERLRAAAGPREVSPSEVVSWFAEALPDLRTVQAIAEACGVDPGWLAFGAASRAPSPTSTLGVPTATRASRWTQPGATPQADATPERPR